MSELRSGLYIDCLLHPKIIGNGFVLCTIISVRGQVLIVPNLMRLLKIHEYMLCFATYPSLETFLDLVFLFTQTSANARSFIQRMWLIPKSLSHFYVFGYCSKILCHFWFQNSTFYYLGSKSPGVLISVPKVRES